MCLFPKDIIIATILYVSQEASFLVVNIFMLKNLSVYVMFKANGEEQEYKARRNVRFFVVFYIVVILIFEVINMYYNFKVWCLDCDNYPS